MKTKEKGINIESINDYKFRIGFENGYQKAIDELTESIDIDLFFTDLIDLKTKKKIEIPKKIQEFLNEYNKYIIERIAKIAKELKYDT